MSIYASYELCLFLNPLKMNCPDYPFTRFCIKYFFQIM